MTWAEVAGSKAVTTDDTSASTVATTMGASVPNGALMWAAVRYGSGAGGNITSLTGGGTWSRVGSEIQLVGPDDWLSLWSAVATSTAAHTVTVNFNVARSNRTLYIGAWTGNDPSGVTDGYAGETDTSTTAPSVTFSTALDGDLLIGITMNNYPNAGTAGSGFDTATSSGGTRPITQETKIQTTASPSTVVDFTGSNLATWIIIGAAFKAAGESSAVLGRPAQLNTAQGRPVQLRPTGINPFTFVR